jgi:hypothetical protein
MFDNLEILDSIRLNFSPAGLLVMNLTIALIMFGIALDLKYKQFQGSARPTEIPGHRILIAQFILLPAVTFLLVKIINPSPAVALGMILVASCPGGLVSNFLSSLAKVKRCALRQHDRLRHDRCNHPHTGQFRDLGIPVHALISPAPAAPNRPRTDVHHRDHPDGHTHHPRDPVQLLFPQYRKKSHL